MAIQEASFDDEAELQGWVERNLHSFLPNPIFIPGFQIKTTSGKGGVPDGFAFDFSGGAWYVIENELLVHQVWPHIAEQITRFVVALKNPETTRQVRDRLFEHIVNHKLTELAVAELDTTRERLHQKIELYIEGTSPTILVFIDRSNRDLEDMVRALDLPTKIFRVQKFIVNGSADYYSPDRNVPVIATQPEGERDIGTSDLDVIEVLGGGELEVSSRRFRVYRLGDKSAVHLKKSRSYPPDGHYWYGIGTSALENLEKHSVSHVVFVLGEEGAVKVPVLVLREFIQNTGVSRNEDGSVRHYHVQISRPPDPEMYWSQEVPRFSLQQYFVPFD